MNYLRRVTITAAVALLMFALAASTSRAQDAGSRGHSPAGAPAQGRAIQPGPTQGRAMTPEEKLVRDVYARLMRYQTASRDELSASGGIANKPEDYLTFELRDIHTGRVEEISGKALAELVTSHSGATINIKPAYLHTGYGPRHASYQAEWAAAPADDKNSDHTTVGEMLRGERFAGFDRYASYEVTVRLGGRERSYRAVALYQFEKGPDSPTRVEILDHVTSEMNTVFEERAPRVRSPWEKYVKSSLYRAVVREIEEAKKAGRPLIEVSAPVGYLPGDNAAPTAADQQEMTAAAACAGPTISGPRNVWWFNGERPSNYDTSITLTASPAGAGSYSWSVTAGSDKVVLSSFIDNTVLVTGLAPSTFHEVSIKVTVDGVTSPAYTISVRAPHRLVLIRDFVHMANTNGLYYETHIHYRIEDQFTDVLPSSVGINEKFTTAAIDDFAGNDWNKTLNAGGTNVAPSDWYDRVTGPDNAPVNPPARAPCSPNLCNTKVYHWNGEWYVGSATSGSGRRVQTNTWERYTDHAEHTNRVSPP
jgi:hypothetical protein